MPRSRAKHVHPQHASSRPPRNASDVPSVSSPGLRFVFVALLAAVSLTSTADLARRNDGVDFFNMWGVPAAFGLTNHGLDSPYRDGAAYLAKLKEHAIISRCAANYATVAFHTRSAIPISGLSSRE